MQAQNLLLFHWEAYYPYEKIQSALTALALPEQVQRGSFLISLPHDYLVQATSSLNSTGFTFGTNDMLSASPNSFTQSVGARFLTETNAKFVLIGKAFSRNQIKESFTSFNDKIKAALANQIIPFFCFGETQEQHEEGKTGEVIRQQLSQCLASISTEELKRIHFIYDSPITVISLSQATPKDLNHAYQICQEQFKSLWGDSASQLKILCALPSHQTIERELLQHSPFHGFYFRMIDTDLSFVGESASNLADLLKEPTFISDHGTQNLATQPSQESLQETQDNVAQDTEAQDTEAPAVTEKNEIIPTNHNVPTVIPPQSIIVHNDFPIVPKSTSSQTQETPSQASQDEIQNPEQDSSLPEKKKRAPRKKKIAAEGEELQSPEPKENPPAPKEKAPKKESPSAESNAVSEEPSPPPPAKQRRTKKNVEPET